MSLVQLKTASEETNYYSKNIIDKIYKNETNKFSSSFLIFLFLSLFSPFLALLYLIYVINRFYTTFIKEVFVNKKKFLAYNSMYQIQVRENVLSIVGYRVEEHELEEHMSIIKNDDKEALSKKQKRFAAKNNAHTHVGLDKNTLTTHVALIGKTGSGKTEGIRSLADDVMKIGGGLIFNDGKSDTKMLNEILNQAKRCNRETSVMLINFLKAESMAETNTFNMLSIMHPIKIVEFLGNLVNDGKGGGGNESYFFNRGKAMLFPVVAGLNIRNKLAGESLSFETIQEYTDLNNINTLWLSFYCMSRDINSLIENNKTIKKKLDSIISMKNNEFAYIEKFIDYVIQNPTERFELENILGFEYTIVKEIYNNVFKIVKTYMSEVWNQYPVYMNPICKITYFIGKKRGLTFFDSDITKICKTYEIKEIYAYLREKHEDINAINREYNLNANGILENEIKTINYAFKDNGAKGNLEDAPNNAIQQHAYAQQQWTVLFSLFVTFKHVFGQGKSEIDPQKILTDNKILYILLPPLELADDQTKILGKIILMTIKEVAGIALGGKEISIHETLKNIRKDMITPKPFTLVVLDEYGAYPISGLSTLLAQVRSINLSLVLGIQDMASLKANGDDVTAQERALANLMKWILKVEDKTTKEWLNTMIDKKQIRQQSSQVDAYGNLSETNQSELKEVDIIKKDIFMNFNNGFSAMIAGSDSDKIVFVQTFFRGGKNGTVFIKRFNNLEF